jgi:RHS repeat-associated protein
LLQEAHFYPFGQEITPLSSKALLKTPNDRMLQQNEWDEEFGLDLHDFDARMYDASIGRFWGVDVLAHQFTGFSPYHYAANNPFLFVDPDGRAFFAAAIVVGKLLGKKLAGKKIAAGIAKAKSKAAKALKFTKASSNGSTELTKWGKFMKSNFRPIAAGTRNVVNNWDNISSREGSFWSAALNFGAGFGGAKLAMSFGENATFWEELGWEGLGALGGGLGNIGVDAAFGVEGDVDYLRSFSRGVNSVISSKFDEKSFKKGMTGEVKRPDFAAFATNSTLNGFNLIAGKFGEMGGESFRKAFGNYAPVKLFFVGAASSSISDALDIGWSSTVKNSGGHGLLFNYSIWTQAFFKDGSKSGLLYLIPEYNKYKNGKFWGPVFSGGGRNMGLQYLFAIMGIGGTK